MAQAVFGGGCFWCTEAIFKRLNGVASVISGYAGGKERNPTYEQVCTGETGYVEAVKIEFDPKTISYETLLEVFFATHDPTTKDRQGADIGSQYRSVIFYLSPEQQQIAEKKKKEIPDAVTEIVPSGNFYNAEDYHQNFYDSRPDHPYCSLIISPKIHKLLDEFGDIINNSSITQ